MTLQQFLMNMAGDCKVRSTYPYDDPDDMRRCLIATSEKLEAASALMSQEDSTRAAPEFDSPTQIAAE